MVPDFVRRTPAPATERTIAAANGTATLAGCDQNDKAKKIGHGAGAKSNQCGAEYGVALILIVKLIGAGDVTANSRLQTEIAIARIGRNLKDQHPNGTRGPGTSNAPAREAVTPQHGSTASASQICYGIFTKRDPPP
jgi:hypothetical protein